jgi:hypothetical protein
MTVAEKKAILQVFEEDASEPFAVLRARELIVHGKTRNEFPGQIDDFFPLMGAIEPMKDETTPCVICWMDRNDEWKKLQGVLFHSFEELESEKPLYKVKFTAAKAFL